MADILPQLIEFATQLDLQRLIVAQTTICLFAAVRSVPVYNLPLLFFGLYAYQHHDSAEPLQQFAGFTAFSILLDIVWCLLSPGIGFGEGLTIAALLIKPMTIISALQLLKYRGDPFSSLGGGNWSGRTGYDGGIGGYQSLGDAMDYERDAEEISISRHHNNSSHQHGRHRNSPHSGSFVTSSSRSTSVKSSKAGSGHNVELGGNTGGVHHGSTHGSFVSAGMTSLSSGGAGTGAAIVASAAAAAAAGAPKDDRRDKVGQNISEDEDEDTSSREIPASGGTENARAGYQAF
ncbi:hypothetical protein BC939DRAFT_440069 [Gamsiella multidivaricata]|uniref:uncharacterized protein n=1 Tax=Gamsiella multidivaricata TaxID=101098 RepID=UPI00221FB537|nr:uncharacterized protein BC939DRAFT_440069 [Gamsiella multidivaricata]KAG0353643.1 hypothetical protein BGZ54_002150 [Gamsiella multidivaricata]KAI7830277.1 hypothetical protein BC939DRAFT_440069 [Gamsiella multidivaricata]